MKDGIFKRPFFMKICVKFFTVNQCSNFSKPKSGKGLNYKITSSDKLNGLSNFIYPLLNEE